MSESDLVGIFVISWIASIILGAVIGQGKGRLAEGLLLGLVLGWIGVLIAALLSDPSQARRDKLSIEREELNLEIQRAQLAQLRQLQGAPPVAPPRPTPSAHMQAAEGESMLTVAREGKMLGEYPLAKVYELLQDGRLLARDHYYEKKSREWRTLDSLASTIGDTWTCRCGMSNLQELEFCSSCKRSRSAII